MSASPFRPGAAAVIHNPVSGRARSRRRAQALVAELAARGYAIHATSRPAHAQDLGRELSESGVEALICVGGDGTLYESIAAVRSNIAIGFYPTGTVNLFALNFSIPRDPELWLELLDSGRTRPVYFGLCNDRPFACVASVGFDAHVVAKVDRNLKKWMQEGAYAVAAVRELVDYKIPKYTIKVDGRQRPGPFVGALIGRGSHYGGTRPVFTDARPSEPVLHVALLGGDDRSTVIRLGVAMVRGKIAELDGVEFVNAKTVEISADPPAAVELDGDAFGQTPALFTVEDEPRRILCPA